MTAQDVKNISVFYALAQFAVILVGFRVAGGDTVFLIGWAIVSALLAYVAFDCFRHGAVDASEIAVVSLYGKPRAQMKGGGFLFALAPFHLTRIAALPQELTIPDLSRGESPVSITVGRSAGETTDPLERRIRTNIRLTCRYRISDGVKYVAAVGEKDEVLKSAVRMAVLSQAQKELAQMPISDLLGELPFIGDRIAATATSVLIDDCGVEILSVLVHDFDLGANIHAALESVPVSMMNVEVNKNNAKKRFFEGEAAADVHLAFQYAKAEGYKVIAEKLGISEAAALYQVDTLANMWRKNNADVNLIGSDLGEVFKLVTSFTQIAASAVTRASVDAD
jgi:regulator of protease activity HflC (stomatin/prohibitin superfamily)